MEELVYSALLVGGPNDGLIDLITETPPSVTTRHCSTCNRPHVQTAQPDDDPLYVLVAVDEEECEATYEFAGDVVDDLVVTTALAELVRGPGGGILG
jgi:hypothetical protein